MMMENKDLEAEIHPLKNEDKKPQGTLGTQMGKEESPKVSSQLSRLSRCRRVVFFLSLFICLFTVFVISFIVPCPEWSVAQGMWRMNFSQAGEFVPLRPAFLTYTALGSHAHNSPGTWGSSSSPLGRSIGLGDVQRIKHRPRLQEP